MRFAEVGRAQLEAAGKDRLSVLDQHDAGLTASQVTRATQLRCNLDITCAAQITRIIVLNSINFEPLSKFVKLLSNFF